MFLKQSTTQVIKFGPFLDKTNGVDLETGLATNLDNATTGIRVSKDGGDFGDRNSSTAPTYDEMGMYNVELNGTDTNTVGELFIIFEESATCLPVWARYYVVEEAIYDSLFGANAGDPSTGDVLPVDVAQISSDTTAATNCESFFDGTGYAGTGNTIPTVTTVTNLTNAPTNGDLTATMKASVNTEVDNSMVTYGLDHLISASVADTDVADNSIIAKFADSTAVTADYTNYDWTTDSLRAIRDNTGTAGAGLTNIGTIATCTTVASGVTLANGAITDASLAGNMETVFETDFTTNYVAARQAWATNVQDTVGTGNLPADVIAVSTSTAAADNLETLFDGNEGFYGAYAGCRGPGVYLNDAAANTNTANGVDGTISNPVSTIAAAKSIADSMSLDRIYITNDSAITLGATMNDYEFVGLGSNDNNSIALNSIDVDQSAFYNLTISGVQGGSARVKYEDCVIGTATLHCYALRCGFTDSVTGVTFSNNDDNVLDSCFSMVAGNATPIFICSGAALDVSFRHYSGGIEIKSSNATATVSIESMGQVVFNADCSTNTAVTMRGLQTVTDNTGGMSALTEGARIDRTAINDQVVDVIKTDTMTQSTLCPQEAPPVNATIEEAIAYLYKAWRNRSTQTATTYSLYADDATTVDQKATVSDDTTTADKGEVGTGP